MNFVSLIRRFKMKCAIRYYRSVCYFFVEKKMGLNGYAHDLITIEIMNINTRYAIYIYVQAGSGWTTVGSAFKRRDK